MDTLNTSRLVRGLAAELNGIAVHPLGTPVVMEALERLGKSLQLDVYPDNPHPEQPRRRNPEYLWDMSWWSNNSCMVLACESEWGKPGAICYDFPKLLVAKARWKLLITDTGNCGGTPERLRPKLDAQLKEHDDRRACETYVWIDARCGHEGGTLRGFEFVPKSNARLDDPLFREVDTAEFRYYRGTAD